MSSDSGIRSVLLNPYSTGKVLGEGAFATVLALHGSRIPCTTTLPNRCAAKCLDLRKEVRQPYKEIKQSNGESYMPPAWVSLGYKLEYSDVEREVSLTQRCQGSTFVIKLHDAFRLKRYLKDQVWMIFDCAEYDLDVITDAKDFVLSKVELEALTAQIIQGLHHIHKQGVIHKDLKLGNILMSRSGKVKICDFGLSQEIPSSGKLAVEHVNQGTDYTMAPELRVQGCEYDESVDIWSLGVCIKALLLKCELNEGKDDLFSYKDPMKIIWSLYAKSSPFKYYKRIIGTGAVVCYSDDWEVEVSTQRYFWESEQKTADQWKGVVKASVYERKCASVKRAREHFERFLSIEKDAKEFEYVFEILRSCFIPYPAHGPEGDITRESLDALGERRLTSDLLQIGFVKSIVDSNLSSESIVIHLCERIQKWYSV